MADNDQILEKLRNPNYGQKEENGEGSTIATKPEVITTELPNQRNPQDKILEKLRKPNHSVHSAVSVPSYANRPAYQPIIPVTSEPSIQSRLNETTRSLPNLNHSDVRELGLVLHRFNQGQEELEIIKKLEDSPTIYGAIYSVKGFFGGKQITHASIYDLFSTQQQNVRDMNLILGTMVQNYQAKVLDIRKRHDTSIAKTQGDYEMKKSLEQKIVPPELRRYDEALKRLEATKEDPKHHDYFPALQELVESRRSCRENKYRLKITGIGQKHHTQDVHNLGLQEDLFETLLYNTMGMACTTGFYQETLDNNLVIWESVAALAEAVKAVSGGVVGLSVYNQQLNDHYIQTVEEVSDIIAGHPGSRMIDSTNSDLKLLVDDLNMKDRLDE